MAERKAIPPIFPVVAKVMIMAEEGSFSPKFMKKEV